jgi:predicted ATPase
VARHYRAAGRPEPAARYFELAGARAVRASAHAEAVGHLREAVALLGQCPDSQARAARELALQTALGASLAQARGFSSEETQAAWQRARDLLETVPDSDRLAETLFGIANFEHTRGRLHAAAAVAERLGRLEGGSRLLPPVSQYLLGLTDYYLGRPRSAADHLARAASAFEGAAEELSERFGADLRIGNQAFLGWALWMLGEVDRAVIVADASIARARASRELPSLAFALVFAATLHKMRRDRERALALAREAGALAERHGYPVWLAVARLIGGWCAIGEESALAQILGAMAGAGHTGNQGAVPHILSIFAEAQRAAGLRDQALATLDGALGLSAGFEMAFWDAELHRLKGEILLETPGGDPAAAEAELNLALEVARRQEARSFELRAATSLARLWRDRGKTADARAVLQPVHAAFTEGFATLDLVEARALLGELGG